MFWFKEEKEDREEREWEIGLHWGLSVPRDIMHDGRVGPRTSRFKLTEKPLGLVLITVSP